MKKIVLALSAILTFSIASAQTDTKQPPQTQPDAGNPKQTTKAVMDAEVQNNPDGVKPAKAGKLPAAKTKKQMEAQPDKTAMDTTMRQDAKTPRKVKKA